MRLFNLQSQLFKVVQFAMQAKVWLAILKVKVIESLVELGMCKTVVRPQRKYTFCGPRKIYKWGSTWNKIRLSTLAVLP